MLRLSEFIEQAWPLHAVTVGDNMRGCGSLGVYRGAAVERDFIVKVVRSPSAQAMSQDLEVFDFLAAHGFRHAPRLLRTCDGATSQRWGNGYAYLYEFVLGEQPRSTVENCTKLGAVVASLHGLNGYERPPRWTTRDVLGQIIQDRAPRLPYRTEYLALARRLRHLDDLPKCLIHGDVAWINCVKDKKGDIVLIDWGGWFGPRILDNAKMLLQFLDGEFQLDETAAGAFYRTYFSIQPVTDEEMSCYFDAAVLMMMNYVLFGQAMEIWTRILWASENRGWLMKLVNECR